MASEANSSIDIKKTIVESATSELTKSVILWLLLLMSPLVVALVPQVRDRILPVLPKPLLVVIVGISLSVNLALFFYVTRLRKTRKELTEQRDSAKTFIKDFTVKWDEHLEPHCPKCLSELVAVVHPTSGVANTGHFKCITCNHGYRLLNEETGKALTLPEAKALLSSDHPRVFAAPSFDRAKLRQAQSDLEALKKNLPNANVKETTIVSFHSILDRLKSETGYDLTAFRIPQSEIKPRRVNQPRSPRIGRYDPVMPPRTTWSEDRFCDRQMFHTAIDSAISRLQLELAQSVDQPQPVNIKLKQAIIRFEALGNLPRGDVEEKYVRDYHSLIATIEQEIGHDLTDFRIPATELQKHITSQAHDEYGELTEVTYTDHRYSSRAMFDLKYKAAKNFIMPYVP